MRRSLVSCGTQHTFLFFYFLLVFKVSPPRERVSCHGWRGRRGAAEERSSAHAWHELSAHPHGNCCRCRWVASSFSSSSSGFSWCCRCRGCCRCCCSRYSSASSAAAAAAARMYRAQVLYSAQVLPAGTCVQGVASQRRRGPAVLPDSRAHKFGLWVVEGNYSTKLGGSDTKLPDAPSSRRRVFSSDDVCSWLFSTVRVFSWRVQEQRRAKKNL